MIYAWLNETPVGRLLVAGTEAGLQHVAFHDTHFTTPEISPDDDWEPNERGLKEPLSQLRAYFTGKLKSFDVPLAADGTDFQKKVWAALCEVPFGETQSYGEIARAIGNPAACRAVGLANGQNPISIIVPCHRIIGRSGKLTGYGGGLDRKKLLLDLESRVVQETTAFQLQRSASGTRR